MSEKIEQLLEKQNELLERMTLTLKQHYLETKELGKLTRLIIRSQFDTSSLTKEQFEYVKAGLEKDFSQ